jgi:hypothetical protein
MPTRKWLDSKSKWNLCYDWWSVGQSVLVSSTHMEPKTRFLLLTVMGLLMWGCLLMWGWIIYNCCWPSPAQLFSDLSLARLVWPYFTVLTFETPPTWRARSRYLYPPGTGWPSYTPRHWVYFLSPMTHALIVLLITTLHGPNRKHRF